MDGVSASIAGHSTPRGARNGNSNDKQISLAARDGLTDYSPKDAPWDVHRGQSDDVGGIYATAVEFEADPAAAAALLI